jgi:hypothetical protein
LSATAQRWSSKTETGWPAVSGATGYKLYRGVQRDLPALLTDTGNSEVKCQGASAAAVDGDSPDSVAGHFFWYLITAANAAGEGPAGFSGQLREGVIH